MFIVVSGSETMSALKIFVLTEFTQRASGFFFCHAVDNGGRIVSISTKDRFVRERLKKYDYALITNASVKPADCGLHATLVSQLKVLKSYQYHEMSSCNLFNSDTF